MASYSESGGMQFVQKTKKDVWQTPSALIDMLSDHVTINLDPCAGRETEHAEVNFRPPETDGLTTSWDVSDGTTTAFINPPFTQKTRWLRRAVGQYMSENVDRLIFLTPDSTDVAEWWHGYIVPYFPVSWFVVSRMDFVDPETGEQAKGVSFNTALSFAGGFPESLFHELRESGDLTVRPRRGECPW